jgi:hypothetical protein
MFQYYSRIFDKYQKSITAFAIFTDSQKGYQPDRFEQSYLGTQLSYRYNTYKILDQKETDLLTSNNPFALVVLMAKAALKAQQLTEEKLLELKVTIAKALLSRRIDKQKVRSLLNFLRYYVRLENPAANNKFEEEINVITQTSRTMGIEEFLLDRAKKEGIKEGVEQGKREFVENLLTKTSFSIKQVADIASVPVAFVRKVKKDRSLESGSNDIV